MALTSSAPFKLVDHGDFLLSTGTDTVRAALVAWSREERAGFSLSGLYREDPAFANTTQGYCFSHKVK